MTGQAELIAFYELTQAKAKYCQTLDTQDWNGLAALMTAGIEFGMSDGHSEPQMTVGRDETLALNPDGRKFRKVDTNVRQTVWTRSLRLARCARATPDSITSL